MGNPRGFTLVELMLSSIIIGLIFASVVATYIMLEKIWREDLVSSELVREADIAVEKMIRGPSGHDGLEEAKSASVPQPDRVEYTDIDDAVGYTRRFYYSNGAIYNEAGKVILSDVSLVAFSKVNNVITIDLMTHRYVVNKEIKFHLQTKVKPRN